MKVLGQGVDHSGWEHEGAAPGRLGQVMSRRTISRVPANANASP
jgi:hypothetical protein